MLNFKQSITTRQGNEIRLYHVYDTYIHGAYKEHDTWHIAHWSIQGYYLLPVINKYINSLDLINNEYYEPEAA